MNRRWLRLTAIVAEREIRQRGRSRAFAVSTIVLLLVVAAGVTIPAILAHHAKPQRVGIVGGPVASMTATVQEAGHLTDSGVTVVPEPSLATAEAGCSPWCWCGYSSAPTARRSRWASERRSRTGSSM